MPPCPFQVKSQEFLILLKEKKRFPQRHSHSLKVYPHLSHGLLMLRPKSPTSKAYVELWMGKIGGCLSVYIAKSNKKPKSILYQASMDYQSVGQWKIMILYFCLLY